MAANVTQISGATEIGFYLRNYTWADMLADLPVLSIGWATDLDKPVARGATTDRVKLLVDATAASNFSEYAVPRANSDGEMREGSISDTGSTVAVATGVNAVVGASTTTYQFEAAKTTATTNAAQVIARLMSTCSATPIDDFGGQLSLGATDASDTVATLAAIDWYWEDASSEWAAIDFSIWKDSSLDKSVTIGSTDGFETYMAFYSLSTVSTLRQFSAGDFTIETEGDATIDPGSGDVYIGSGAAGVDYNLIFDGENNNGTLSFLEDEGLFQIDKKLTFTGDATTWEDINIDLSPLQSGGSAPGFTTIASTGIRMRSFATGENVDSSFEIPHAYELSSDIHPHIHMMPVTTPSGTDYIAFELTYFVVDHEGVVSTATTISTGDIAVDTQWERVDADFPTFSHAALGGQVGFKIERVAASGAAYSGEVAVLTFGFHYEKDDTGSELITTK